MSQERLISGEFVPFIRINIREALKNLKSFSRQCDPGVRDNRPWGAGLVL